MASTVLSTIGATIRRVRTARNLSQEDVATAISVDRGYFSRIESGKHNVSVLVLGRVALALGVRLDELCVDVTQEVLAADVASGVSDRGPPKRNASRKSKNIVEV